MATIELSQSVLGKHRECPQKWHYEVERRLAPKPSDVYPVSLAIGSWWHALMAAHYLGMGRLKGTLVEGGIPENITTTNGGPILPVDIDPSGVLMMAEQFYLNLTDQERTSWDEQRSETLPETLDRMYATYTERWAEREEFCEPLAVEMPLRRSILTDDSGDEYVLTGIADLIYYDTEKRIVVLVDHKTAKTIDSDSSADAMLTQMPLYTWGLDPVVADWGYGPIRALSYDRIRTAIPATPKVTATGTLAKTPSDYDFATYSKWVASGVPWGEEGVYYKTGKKAGEPKFGVYEAEQAVVERLLSPEEQARWADRTLRPVNPNAVMTHLQAAVMTAEEVERSRARVAEMGHTVRNFGKQCDYCPMFELCRAEMSGGPGSEFDPAEFGLVVRPPRDR